MSHVGTGRCRRGRVPRPSEVLSSQLATMEVATLCELAARAKRCRICVERPLSVPLPHAPRPVFSISARARILVAGQAPGKRVHESGTPFADRSGDRLREWMGVTTAEFYDPDRIAFLPMGFCFPGNDRHGGDLPPRRECAPAWREPMLELMPEIELVLAIGQYAQTWHLGLGRGSSLTETVRDWRRHMKRKVLPLPHPSWHNTNWLKRNPWFEAELLPALRTEIRSRIHGQIRIS
jgi:uracil-DNA glycosylase